MFDQTNNMKRKKKRSVTDIIKKKKQTLLTPYEDSITDYERQRNLIFFNMSSMC
jgi:hypothetical protein